MKCYKHTDRDAVAICGDCRRGLCSECASRYVVPVCDFCVEKARSCHRKDIRNYFICFYVGIAILLAFFIVGFVVKGKPVCVLLRSYAFFLAPFTVPAFRLVKIPGCLGFLFKMVFIWAFCFFGFPVTFVHMFFKIKREGDGVYNGSGWVPALRFLLKNVVFIVGVFMFCYVTDLAVAYFVWDMSLHEFFEKTTDAFMMLAPWFFVH